MYTIENYYKDIHLLTNSLVVKITDIGIAINIGIKRRYDIVTSDNKKEWKYFLNMSGEKHFSNKDVKIRLVENNELVSLTKNILDTFIYTRDELLKYGEYYNKLVYNHPDEIGYIQGCMLPVDLDFAINSPDGSILNYNKNLVEYNEYTLIRNLEDHIQNFLFRYHIQEYILSDELYIPSLLAVLYSTLPNKISNLRLSKINTNEVHSFHLEHFFRSRLDLYDNIINLKPKTKMWLYKNLNYIMKHIGKQETLDTIAVKIFEESDVGVGSYLIDKNDPELIEDVNNIYNSIYNLNEPLFIANKLNNKYEINENSPVTISTMVDIELTRLLDQDTELGTELIVDITNKTREYLSNKHIFNQQTKILDVSTIKLFKQYSSDHIAVLTNYWLSLAISKKYITPTIFIDPNNKLVYELTPYEGILVLIKLFMKLTNKLDTKLTKISYCVLKDRGSLDFDELITNMHSLDYTMPYVLDVIDNLPNSATIVNNSNDYTIYITKIYNYFIYLWLLDSNSENPILHSNLKLLNNRLLKNYDYLITDDISGETIDNILNNNSINFELTHNYDVLDSIKELYYVFTGVNINQYDTLEQLISSFTILLNKLTSYTVQVVNSFDNVRTIYAPYNHNDIFKTTQGLVTVLDAEIKYPLEQEFTWLKAFGNNWKDRLQGIPILSNPYPYLYNYVNGVMEIREITNDVIYSQHPNFTVEISNKFIPYMYPEIKTDTNNFIDSISNIERTDMVHGVNKININNENEIVMYNNESVEDKLEVYLDMPNVIIELEE